MIPRRYERVPVQTAVLVVADGRAVPTGVLWIAPHVEQVQAIAFGSSFMSTGQAQV